MKIKTRFVCENCGNISPKWLGKCSECSSWNSFVEEQVTKATQTKAAPIGGNKPKLISELVEEKVERFSSGIGELNRVLGGGVVPGSVVLIGGEPGIGKSTLLLELCGKLGNSESKKKILYVSGEESEGQIFERFRRLNITSEKLSIYHETVWENVKNQLQELKPDLLILDSIQTTHSQELNSLPGTVSQIRDVAFEVMNYSKKNKLTSFIVGHITKEGTIAGPKILEHMVDTVIYFEGDRSGMYRMLRVMKNRFGNVHEVGMFEMKESGLKEVINPSQYFLENPLKESYGRSLTCILEGNRPIFVELQALVVDSKHGQGRRNTQGLDSNRLAMLVAVLEKYFGLAISFSDIYLNVVGGIKLSRTDTDLGILAALLSSIRCKNIPEDIVFLGEVGLTGEVRSVSQLEQRLKEMQQLNYKKIITSKRSAQDFKGKFDIEMIGIEKASDLNEILFQ